MNWPVTGKLTHPARLRELHIRLLSAMKGAEAHAAGLLPGDLRLFAAR